MVEGAAGNHQEREPGLDGRTGGGVDRAVSAGDADDLLLALDGLAQRLVEVEGRPELDEGGGGQELAQLVGGVAAVGRA